MTAIGADSEVFAMQIVTDEPDTTAPGFGVAVALLDVALLAGRRE